MALAAISEGQLAFAGYRFNRSFILTDMGFENTVETADIPFAPGTYASVGKPGPKTFGVTGYVAAAQGGAILNSSAGAMLSAADVQDELDLLGATYYAGPQPFQFRPDRYMLAQVGKPKITYGSASGYRFAQIVLDFTAHDPRSFGNIRYALTAVSGAAAITAYNLGNTLAYPVLTFTFPAACVNPRLTISPPQVPNGPAPGTYAIGLVGAFVAGDVVVVTCDPRRKSVTKNGVATWSPLSVPAPANTLAAGSPIAWTLFSIPPGISTLSATSTSGSFAVALDYRDTWL